MRRVRRRCGTLTRAAFSIIPLAFIGLSVFVGVSAFESGEDPDIGALVLGGVMLLISGGFLIAIWLGETGVRNAKFVTLARDAGVCPACAAPICSRAPGTGCNVNGLTRSTAC